MSTSELATSYAALILADDGVEITVRPQFVNNRNIFSNGYF
jgi:hypothetical protein